MAQPRIGWLAGVDSPPVTPVWRFFAKITPLLLVLTLAGTVPASAETSGLAPGPVSPSQWPRPFDQGPTLEGWPNALRIWGPDRYQTSLATALTMRGLGDFPFNSPNPSPEGTNLLERPGPWWGLQTCPRSIIVVAGDSPADALAATALSDPTDASTEPYLRRSAAADPLFDPIGGYNRVDTHAAAVLLTRSTRDGAFGLSTSVRIAAKDFRSGGCSTARQAIIVGGTAAVPAAVDEELVALGFSEVFRVEGLNRYQTAAKVAIALGTASIPEPGKSCVDVSARNRPTEMGFYANSVIEWRASADLCTLLGNTVVLTDGIIGADALAAGWWTSFWQVPVLLHNGRENLPIATRQALQSIGIENLVVLGGTERISSQIAEEAGELAGAKVWRIAGPDRYSTSIQMAKTLGGWWPTGRAVDAAASMLCIVASDPSGLRALGWPDALSAGPWCGAAGGNASNPRPPERALYPINGQWPAVTSTPSRSARSSVPIILVPSGAEKLPTQTAQFLDEVFPPTDLWCSTESVISGCATPGFAVIFGGSSAITDVVVGQISSAVGGLVTPLAPAGPTPPNQTFATKLSMAPVYHQVGEGDVALCSQRGELRETRWLAAGIDESPRVIWNADLLQNGWYLVDSDGTKRSPGIATNGCVRIDSTQGSSQWVRSIGPYGRASTETRVKTSANRWTYLDGAVEASSPQIFSGIDSGVDPASGGETVLRLNSGTSFTQVIRGGETTPIVAATLSLTVQRGVNGAVIAPDRFVAQWTIETHQGSVTGSASGEAVFNNGIWAMRGPTSLISGTWAGASARGGFRADLATGRSGSQDDSVVWQIDGLATN
mgnify:CR=1 FL=1